MENRKKLIKDLVKTKEKIEKLPKEEKNIIESEIASESVYYSNRLEGNKLSKEKTRKAIISSS